MEYIKVKKSDLAISRIGFGGGPLGQHGWTNVNIKELISCIPMALDNGINFFDTADCYGLGDSEVNLAKGLEGNRQKAIIATKFGVRISSDGKSYYDNSKKYLDYALNESLRRLKTDVIDLYQIHYWDGITPLEDTLGELSRKCEEGKIRHFGVTNIDLPFLKDYKGLLGFSYDASLVSKDYESKIESTLSNSELVFIAHSVLGQGVLSGKYDMNTRFLDGDRRNKDAYTNFHSRLTIIVSFLENVKNKVLSRSNMTMPQLAVKWVLQKFDRSTALVGIRSKQQLETFLKPEEWILTDEDMITLEKLSMILNTN